MEGAIGAFMSIQTYIVDNYNVQAASALAAASAFRSLAGFCFPLFAGEHIVSSHHGTKNIPQR